MQETTQYLGGKAEIAIGEVVIEPQYLSEIAVEITEGERSTESLAGTITQPSGMIESAQVTGTFLLPSMDALKAIFQEAYSPATGTGTSGHVVFGSNSCTTKTPLPVNIHFTCDENSDNDVHIFAGIVKGDLSMTYNQSDVLSVPFTIYAMPTEDGYAQVGAGDLTKPTLWDPTTQTWKEVTEPGGSE